MYGPKIDEVTEDRWSLHDEMVRDLNYSEYFGGDKIMRALYVACSAFGAQVRCI